MYTKNFTSENSTDYREYAQPKAQKKMSSQRKAEEDITPECEEHGNPPMKRKMDSLLPEVGNAKMKDLVTQEADVKITGNFSLSKQQGFVDISALFAATISEHVAIIDTLVGKYPNFQFVKTKEKTQRPDCLIHGNAATQERCWSCWKEAIKLRESNAIPKTFFPQTKWEELALKNLSEFQTTEDVDILFGKRRSLWNSQAFLISQRILKKYDLFPNGFVVYSFFQFALYQWGKFMLPRPRAFAISMTSLVPKSETQITVLKRQLETYIINYENKWINQKPNLKLLKACAAYQGQTNDFKLFKLLLEAGANPNAVDQHRCSPLHLLANKDSRL